MNLAEMAFDAAETLSACGTLEALSTRFTDAITQIGLTACACGMVTGPKATSGDPFFFTNWPSGWMKLYMDSDFVRIDPLPRWALTSGLPVAWSAPKATLRPSDPGHAVYRAAGAWGFTEGMAVPVRSQSGALGLVTSGGDRTALTDQERTFVTTISAAAFHRANIVFDSGPPFERLATFSQREKDIILLLHQGFTDEELADILGISIQTVRSHILNARLKAGARSRTHLVALTSGAAPFS